MRTDPIRAAGAVVWRGDERHPEVAVVHRPRYDDWSFPKGKLKPGEHVVAAALREVREETGLTVELGRALPLAHYTHLDRPKRVDYWAARVTGDDGFVPGDEVDELRWLSLDAARDLLTYEWDVSLLPSLVAAPLATVPLVVARHGDAEPRESWAGDDARRPLNARGRAQAATLAEVLPAYLPVILLSSPTLRCVQTLEAYNGDIRQEALLSEEGHDPRGTPALVSELPVPAVVCSHGKVLPPLIAALSGQDVHLRKGAFAVLHRLGERVISLECHLT